MFISDVNFFSYFSNPWKIFYFFVFLFYNFNSSSYLLFFFFLPNRSIYLRILFICVFIRILLIIFSIIIIAIIIFIVLPIGSYRPQSPSTPEARKILVKKYRNFHCRLLFRIFYIKKNPKWLIAKTVSYN